MYYNLCVFQSPSKKHKSFGSTSSPDASPMSVAAPQRTTYRGVKEPRIPYASGEPAVREECYQYEFHQYEVKTRRGREIGSEDSHRSRSSRTSKQAMRTHLEEDMQHHGLKPPMHHKPPELAHPPMPYTRDSKSRGKGSIIHRGSGGGSDDEEAMMKKGAVAAFRDRQARGERERPS